MTSWPAASRCSARCLPAKPAAPVMSARTPASYHPRHLISVLIPVRNGGDELGRCLDAIDSQRIDEEFEVLVIDSGSTDDTVAIARAHGARVHTIPHSEFHHGA